jgi:hypothetical protein
LLLCSANFACWYPKSLETKSQANKLEGKLKKMKMTNGTEPIILPRCRLAAAKSAEYVVEQLAKKVVEARRVLRKQKRGLRPFVVLRRS